MTRYWVLISLFLLAATDLMAQAQDSDFRFSYTLTRGNQTSTSILPDGTISFPDTTVNVTNPSQSQTTSAIFVITNRGIQVGTVNSITTTAEHFKLSSVPVVPAVLQPNQSLTFSIDFQPAQLGQTDGALRIGLIGVQNFRLLGNGVGPLFAFDFTLGSSTRTVSPNDTLTFPQTALGDKTTGTMRIRNVGNLEGSISAIASSDLSFALENVPFVPLVLKAGADATFNINFTPQISGTLSARLKIGDASFNLAGTGLGATLTFTSVVGSANTTLAANGTVIFTLTPVGSTSSAQVLITNTGTTAAFVNSISVTGPATGVFTLTNVPSLPMRIDSGATARFGIAFAPIGLGQNAGTLRVDNQTFNLSGVGDAPPALPAVSFPGITATADAAQQLAVGITLDNAYPVQLNGKLTLAFSPNADVFGDDPAIAFATGGRTVNFTIPANTRTAVFGINDNRIRFQTGTVAGSINLVATFVTDGGNINLTVANPPATNIAVRSSAPRISSVQLVNRAAGSFTVVITGYSPTRSMNAMDFTFVAFVDPADKNLKLDTKSLNLPVNGPFSVWYQNSASQAFGSLFTASLTFNVRGNIESIQSLSVTMTNSLGTSNSGSVVLR